MSPGNVATGAVFVMVGASIWIGGFAAVLWTTGLLVFITAVSEVVIRRVLESRNGY